MRLLLNYSLLGLSKRSTSVYPTDLAVTLTVLTNKCLQLLIGGPR